MAVLLAVCAWLAARLVAGPRVAFFVAAALLVLFDVAAVPSRNAPEYDDLQAFYRTDQVLETQLPVPTADAVVSVVAQPVFAGAQPRFGLSGQVGGASLQWKCDFRHGIQRLALPLPRQAMGTIDVKLRLTGSPSRDGDYLIVYASSLRGGFLVSLERTSSLDPSANLCTAA
jgi:hypothetical protein